ncbi:sugar ABC transporter permease [Blautia sp. RD014234]|nr:sugar ABC transporter permease [Blautia parvula]
MGIINILAVKLGAITESISWLGNIGSAFWCVVLVAIWKGIPFQMIFILAALQGIPGDVYESAEIDGASRFQCFWRITLPIIKEPLAIATILNLIGIVSCFNTIWLMTGGGPCTVRRYFTPLPTVRPSSTITSVQQRRRLRSYLFSWQYFPGYICAW